MKRFEFHHKDRKHLIAEGLRCPVCDGEVYERGSVPEPYAQIRYSLFHCPGSGHELVLRVDSLDGHIKIHFYALPDDVTLGWFHEPMEEPEPEPIVSALEPVVARESEAQRREKQLQIERTANALEAHRKIADMVLSNQRNGLAFIDRSTVLARLLTHRGRRVWAVDARHPEIGKILEDHGGKLIVANAWAEAGLIIVGTKNVGNGKVHARRTFNLTVGARGDTMCYLFLVQSFEAARKGIPHWAMF